MSAYSLIDASITNCCRAVDGSLACKRLLWSFWKSFFSSLVFRVLLEITEVAKTSWELSATSAGRPSATACDAWKFSCFVTIPDWRHFETVKREKKIFCSPSSSYRRSIDRFSLLFRLLLMSGPCNLPAYVTVQYSIEIATTHTRTRKSAIALWWLLALSGCERRKYFNWCRKSPDNSMEVGFICTLHKVARAPLHCRAFLRTKCNLCDSRPKQFPSAMLFYHRKTWKNFMTLLHPQWGEILPWRAVEEIKFFLTFLHDFPSWTNNDT